MPAQPWTDADLAYLRAHWPLGGWRVVKAYFTAQGRSSDAVGTKANLLGLHVTGRKSYRKQGSTEWIDACLRREYASGRPKLKALARQVVSHCRRVVDDFA